MKKFLQTIFSIRNENNHKILTILGLKFKFYDQKLVIKKMADALAIDRYQKNWQDLKTYVPKVSAMQTAEFICENMPTVPFFENRYDLHTHALEHVEKEGMYLEFGVYVGKSINHIAKKKPNETIYGFDSFEGLPEAWLATHDKGHFKMDALPEVESNVKLIKGWFDESLPKFVEEHGDFDIAYLNVDCDLYSSTKTVFDNLKGHISKGTVIHFDDYFNYPGWQQQEFKAFMEFLEETGLEFEYLGYTRKNTKVAVRIK